MTIFINNSDLLGPDWRFVQPYCRDPQISWEFHYGQPRNRLERAIRRPNIARYRAAFTAARSAARTPSAVLVSHLPRISAATNVMRRMLCPQVPQIAFAFTFTELPRGPERALLRRALRGVHEFVSFSRFERRLYAEHFDLPLERFRWVPWAMEAPAPGERNPVGPGGYLCSIGGEGRDYAVVAEAMRRRPRDRMVIVARPHSIEGIAFPDNVTVLTNRPAPETWRIAVDSAGIVVPLLTERTVCGHGTIVASQLLGIPMAMTRSIGILDYVPSPDMAHLVPAGDATALSGALGAMLDDPEGARAMAGRAQAIARTRSSPDRWAAYFIELRDRLQAGSAA